MEDDNGLELSLGLGFGGSSTKSKGKNGSFSDTKLEEGDKGNKMVDDFRNFFHASSQKQDSNIGSQMSDTKRSQENFFSDLSKANADVDASVNLKNRGIWASSNNRHAEVDEEKRQDASSKRKMLFDEINNQKKQERDAHHSDVHEKISITTEDGSTADNEDVAESEVDGSSSRVISHHDVGSKRFIGVGASSEAPKGFSDSGVIDLQGQRRTNGSSETEIKHGNLNYGVPFSVRPPNIMNMPYSFPTKDSNSIGVPTTSGPLPERMRVIPTSNAEQQTGAQSATPGNMSVTFGYSPLQLPKLNKDNSWSLMSHLQQYSGRDPLNSDKPLKIVPGMQVIPRNTSEASLYEYDGRALDRVKGDGKHHVAEEGSSSHTEEDVKVSNTALRPKDASGPSTAEAVSLDYSAIKPGIASELKFGGCGSYPNLPWVSTTGSGPNARTISGVTYMYSANQIRIVCACHGSHMSPDEFIRHASEENVNPENGSGFASFTSATSAQS